MLDKINRLTNWQAALIITLVGFAVFFTGLNNPFQGDDISQIVNNAPVHSIRHIKLFFEGGTFYNGQGLAPLSGAYYRPLMTTIFSLLYTLFGAHPMAFHLLQMSLCIGSAILLYMVFRHSFKPALALFLSLVFLVHPINSQVVFAIPSMQDALFLFFGMLALYLLFRFTSARSLLFVAACLLLSLLAKETGALFIAMALLFLFWFDRRKRLFSFMAIMAPPIALWLTLKIHAVGLHANPANAPIDSLGLGGRLLTAPSIGLFYITKFLFPWKLASAYYWTHPTFSVRYVLLPLIINLTAAALFVCLAFVIRKKASRTQYLTYLFFGIWSTLGLLLTLQIIPLDMTACETWFYFPMIGVLGMIGVVLSVFPPRIRPTWILLAGAAVIGVLGFCTALRGLDWKDPYLLAYKNITASKDDYIAYNIIASRLDDQGNFIQAKTYASHSINIFPNFVNYNNLGLALTGLGDYSGAVKAYNQGLKLGNYSLIYENAGVLTLVYGTYDSNKQFFINALEQFPRDTILWTYLAILEDRNNDNADAKVAISNAATYGQVPQFIYDGIMNNQSFTINFSNTGKSITVE